MHDYDVANLGGRKLPANLTPPCVAEHVRMVPAERAIDTHPLIVAPAAAGKTFVLSLGSILANLTQRR